MSRNAPDPVAVLRGHHAEVQALAFLDERVLLTGDAEGEVRAWDLDQLRPFGSRRAHPAGGGVLHLQAFHWRGRSYLVTQGRDMAVDVWQLGSDLQLPREPLHSMRTLADTFCSFSILGPQPRQEVPREPGLASQGPAPANGPPADSEVASSGSGTGSSSDGSSIGPGAGPLQHPNNSAPAQPHTVMAPAPAAQGLVLAHECPAAATAGASVGAPPHSPAPPPHLLALPSGDSSAAELWCCACGRQLAVVGQAAAERQYGMLTCLQLFHHPSRGPCLAAGYEGGWVAVWGLGSSDLGSSGGAGGSGAVRRGGSSGAVSGGGGGSGALAREPLAARQLHEEPVLALHIDGSGAGGVSGGADARLVFFKLSSEAAAPGVSKGEDEGGGLGGAGAKTGPNSAPGVPGEAGTGSGAIKVRRVAALKAPGVNDVAVRGDGKIVAAAGWDGRVRIFNYRTAAPLAVLKYHRSAVAAVQFSPHTHLLASGSRDGTVALWSIYQRPAQQGS